MLNRILESLGRGIGNLSNKIQPKMKKGKIKEFWDWVDEKWYRATIKR